MFEGLFDPIHIIVVLIIALLFFGPGRLGDLGSSLGKGIKEFKKAINEREDDKKVVQSKVAGNETASSDSAGKEAS